MGSAGWPGGATDLGRLMFVVGAFDGLHRGHRYLLACLRDAAAAQHARPAVITFDHHPDEILVGTAPPVLCDPDERLVRFEQAGVDVVVIQHFDAAVRMTPYDEFVRAIAGQVELAGFLMTPDAAFGHDRGGTPESAGRPGPAARLRGQRRSATRGRRPAGSKQRDPVGHCRRSAAGRTPPARPLPRGHRPVRRPTGRRRWAGRETGTLVGRVRAAGCAPSRPVAIGRGPRWPGRPASPGARIPFQPWPRSDRMAASASSSSAGALHHPAIEFEFAWSGRCPERGRLPGSSRPVTIRRSNRMNNQEHCVRRTECRSRGK